MKGIAKKIIALAIVLAFVISVLLPMNVKAASGSWKQTNGRWWYQYANGSYAHSEYIDGYWLDSAGWYDSAWNGSWAHDSTGWWFESGNWYPTGQWMKIDGDWYYFKNSGYMACSEWIGNYYLSSSGVMATNTWIGEYYVDGNGEWVKGKKKSETTEAPKQETTTSEPKHVGGNEYKTYMVISYRDINDNEIGQQIYTEDGSTLVSSWRVTGGDQVYYSTSYAIAK